MNTTDRRPLSRTVEVCLPRDPKPEFKQLGGSDSDHFNQMLANGNLNGRNCHGVGKSRLFRSD
jgi:hypothetical protein